MFKFLNYDAKECQYFAKKIIDFETKIATGKMDKVDRRDPAKTYNPKSVSEIQEILPMFSWDKYLSNIGVATDTIIAFTAVAVNTIVRPTTTTAISVPTRSILIPLHTSACVVGNKQ